MAKIRIPDLCLFCRVPPEHQEGFKYPHQGERILTRVAWHGMEANGRHSMTWEHQAGEQPKLTQFPGLKFIPKQAWCPNCLVEYHVGGLHPQDDDYEETKMVIT